MSPQPKKILLLTNSERGQANVVLATAHALIDRGCLVHVASFSPLAARVAEIKSATFHLLHGEAMVEAAHHRFSKESELMHGTGVREATRMYPKLMDLACVWEGDEYIRGYQSARKIIEAVDPDVVVVEKMCAQAADACNALGRRFVCLSPVSFKETLVGVQPWGYGLWGWPADISGFPFPVPWYLIPINIYLFFRLIIAVVFSPRIKMVAKSRLEAGLKGPYPFMEPYTPTNHYLIPSTVECDFPCPNIPSNVTACGPILMPSPRLSTVDSSLTKWLRAKPTVLMCQGSNFVADLAYASQQASALRILLENNSEVQVLWKLNMKGVTVTNEEKLHASIAEILSKEIGEGRIKIEKWLKAEPSAIIASGYIVCSVHHGGANSYFEAVHAGVPQVVLPAWYDTYDFAQRVEMLGIGVYGNRSVAPKVDAAELSRALITITSSEDGAGKLIQERAKELGKSVRKYGGRDLAAEKILELAEKVEFSGRD